MLDRNTPAKFISFVYETFTVRFHIHSEDSSIWVVGKDLCNILHKTNPSYLTKYLPKEAVVKHKINTLKGSQSILWFKVDNLRYIKHNLYLKNFIYWLDTQIKHKLSTTTESLVSLKEPILVEKKDLESLLKIVKNLTQQLDL